mgnify:CR=1 FL=1
MKTITVMLDGVVMEIPHIEEIDMDHTPTHQAKVGRPATVGGRTRSISIDDDRFEFFKWLGEGNVSEGVRRAADMLKEGKRP